MTLNFKVIKRALLLMLMMTGISACQPNPKNDIPLFQEFIDSNINKISDDPYISSSVIPGDNLYEYLMKLQHGSGYPSLLRPLIEKENTDAMYWYALLKVTDIASHREVLQLLNKAASKGNADAALALSNVGETCRYFSNSLNREIASSLGIQTDDIASNDIAPVCSPKNFELAEKLFEKRAENGDLRAQYFLLNWQNLQDSNETRPHYINEIIRFSEAHYYGPLMGYIDSILVFNDEKHRFEAKKKDVHHMVIQLLIIAANNNYIPAIRKIISISDDQKLIDRMVKKGIKLGSPYMVNMEYYNYKEGSNEQNFYNYLYKSMTGDFLPASEELADEDDVLRIEAEVKNFLKDVHYPIYIDPFTLSYDWTY
jgi:TPR repeat protein